MITVKHIKTGQVETISDDVWAKVCENGHENEYEKLPNPKPPKEVAAAISAGTVGRPKNGGDETGGEAQL